MESDAKEMTALWLKYKETKAVEVRNEIAEKYLQLVRIVCGRLAVNLPVHVDKDDLLSSGYFGLLDAIERYDVKRQIKFETYAGVRIRGAMLDYLREVDWLPVSKRQKLRQMEQTRGRLENRLGRTATEAEIARELAITIAEVRELAKESQAASVIPLEEYLKTDTMQDPANDAEKLELKEELAGAIECLPERERQVVTLYYYEELTLKEISQVMDLTEARISQIHKQAINRIRVNLGKEGA